MKSLLKTKSLSETKKLLKNRGNLKYNSLSKTVISVSMINVFITVCITSSVALISMNVMVRNMAQDQAKSSINIMQKEMNNLEENLISSANVVAVENEVVELISSQDKSSLLDTMTKTTKAMNIEIATIVDKNGNVIVRTHDTEKAVDNLSTKNSIQKALSGDSTSEINSDATGFYAITASAPISDKSGTIIGAVSLSYDLRDLEFVDGLKKLMNDDFTVFEGNKRVSTTIINNGKRAIGTTLDAKVADIVIKQKKQYTGKAKILERNYITMYNPIMSSDGTQVTGILFSGSDMTSVENKITNNILLIVVLSIIAIIFNLIISSRIMRIRLKLPLQKVVSATKSIEIGVMDDKVKEELALITKNDEIGLLARSMEGAINSVETIAKDINVLSVAISKHDLTADIDTSRHNGMYKTIVEIVDSLFSEISSIIKEIRIASESMGAGSEQVSSASQSLAQGATEQASSTEELAATIAEIAQQIKNSAVNANMASTLSIETGEEVLVSSSYMQEMLVSMEDIRKTSEEIDKIINTIESIAFETNMLALNASIEAARAGSAGKGFSVVAEEVRNLASKSTAAAKSTNDLISSSAIAVEKGDEIAKLTEEALKRVATKTNKANEIIREIAQAAQSQSNSIVQINSGIEQISKVVQTNSATSEETAAASEELTGQAQSLLEMISTYKLKKDENTLRSSLEKEAIIENKAQLQSDCISEFYNNDKY